MQFVAQLQFQAFRGQSQVQHMKVQGLQSHTAYKLADLGMCLLKGGLSYLVRLTGVHSM